MQIGFFQGSIAETNLWRFTG